MRFYEIAGVDSYIKLQRDIRDHRWILFILELLTDIQNIYILKRFANLQLDIYFYIANCYQ